MSFTFADKGRQKVITSGVYHGQDKPVLLGDKDLCHQFGNHYVGFQKGEEYIKIRAFFDADALLSNNQIANLNKISYVQFGQLSIYGVPIPLSEIQRFFESKSAIAYEELDTKIQSGLFSFGRQYWWIDAFATDSRRGNIVDPYFPLRARHVNAGLSDGDFFMFPKPFGNYVRRAGRLRTAGESLCASLATQVNLSNLPRETKHTAQEAMILKYIDEIDLSDTYGSLNFSDDASYAFSVFEDVIAKTIREKGFQLSQAAAVQRFDNFFLIRGTFSGTTEKAHVITFDGRGFCFTALDVPAGTTDVQVEAYVKLNVKLADRPMPGSDAAPSEFKPFFEMFPYLYDLFEEDGLPKNFSVQFLGAGLLVRGNLKNPEEDIVFLGVEDANADDTMNFYEFDRDIYFDLDENEEDPLHLYTDDELSQQFTVSREMPYTIDELVSFFKTKRLVAPKIDLAGYISLGYNFITLVMLLVDAQPKPTLYILDGFQWQFSRFKNKYAKVWDPVGKPLLYKVPLVSNSDQVFALGLLERYYRGKVNAPELRIA